MKVMKVMESQNHLTTYLFQFEFIYVCEGGDSKKMRTGRGTHFYGLGEIIILQLLCELLLKNVE